ncbi:uncharacterized protein NKAPD1-like [Saccostrea echinata]|uniref:uncharacterized protein NKAPD1-like n=1 Tax=Saccostrea echinata TaxID=191078 RepID=UPI002A7FC73C|nr:uncharacterized protein NKAPD1-like [Saccostrea echinata]XP_061184631.1 uncharacterized protein NKAPD1-like [Saccostrea echinata]
MTEKMSSSKTLLKNHIRHATSHNKIVEESLMWRQYEMMNAEKCQVNSRKSKYTRDKSYKQDRQKSSSYRFSKKSGRSSSLDLGGQSKPSFYWTKELQKAEEAIPDRWDHSGYKELHPEEFQTGSDTDSKCKSSEKKKKIKLKKKKRKRKHKEKNDSGDDDDIDDEQERNRKRKREKLKRKKHKHVRADDRDSSEEHSKKRVKCKH